MKKLFVSLLLLPCTLLAMAAADFSGLKIYINPGHGGWNEVNDRHIPTIPFPQYTSSGMIDTLGFWESSSNLKVAFDLEKLLLDHNAEKVLLSRRDNRSGMRDDNTLDFDKKYKHYTDDPYVGDRPFSSIKAECAAFNADLLLSIHSNAAGSVGAAANYVVAFIEGNETCTPDQAYTGAQYAADPTAFTMATSIVKHMRHDLDSYHEAAGGYIWSYYKTWSLISPSDGTQAYRPTVLCEASFHSYLPNTHRFLNRDYQTMEAYRFYYGFCEIWNIDPLPTGIVAGIVRSKNFKETRSGMGSYIAKPSNHPEGAPDRWKTMDNANVDLMKDGKVLQSYTTDNYCNGLYVFYDVNPGDYQVRIRAPHAVELIEDVTVTAGTTASINSFVTDSDYIRPKEPDYPELATPTSVMPSPLQLKEYPIVKTPELDALNIHRMYFRGEQIFVLTEEGQIYIFDTNSGKQTAQLSTNGIQGKVGDIAFTSDSVLLACNLVTMKSSSKTPDFKVYQYTDLNADPTLLYEFIPQVGIRTDFTIGQTMTIMGPSWWHRIVVSAISADSKQTVSLFGANYMNIPPTVGIQESMYLLSVKAYTVAKWGSDFRFRVTPNDGNDIGYFLVDGATIESTEFYFDFNLTAGAAMTRINLLDDEDYPASMYGSEFFCYGGENYWLAPVCDAGGVNIGMNVYKMPENKNAVLLISIAQPITEKFPAAGLNVAPVEFMQAGVIPSGEDLTFALYLKGIGIARYSTREYTALETLTNKDIRSLKRINNGVVEILNGQNIYLLNGMRK
ncbi:MAG: N-acetylmuramoyl-L-alanine amidase [Bacteroidales bacterium]|nr:N-acetylmuramoyl-L-alanine amidase [Candidatus Colicola coprequi]